MIQNISMALVPLVVVLKQKVIGTTQTDGFSFGQGQAGIAGIQNQDLAGPGGGWFGGFSSQSPNGGGGTGSSFVGDD